MLLETVLGLALIYLLFSLLVSWLNELYTSWTGLRGKFLRRYLTRALRDPFNQNWGELLYAHPSVRLLARREGRPPAYIPSHLFALGLIDLLLAGVREGHFEQDKTSPGKEVRYVPGALPYPDDRLRSLAQAVDQLNESDVKTLLRAVLDHADSLEAVKTELAVWYDEYMDRVSGWYKQRVRRYIFWLALGVSVAFNLDSLRLARAFYQSGPLRALAVQAAADYVRAHPAGPPAPSGSTTAAAAAELAARVQEAQRVLGPLQLPLGWRTARPAGQPLAAFLAEQLPGGFWLGWLLTALALSFGAPFWFDVLKNVANLRGAGPQPAAQRENSPRTLTQSRP